jgi:hypothetical protein
MDQAAAQAKQTDTAAQNNFAATRSANEILAQQEERMPVMPNWIT